MVAFGVHTNLERRLDDAQHILLEHDVNYAPHLLGKFGNRGHN